MPTGSAPVATMHVARTITRRAERKVCEIIAIEGEMQSELKLFVI